jgi:hypothetical protein
MEEGEDVNRPRVIKLLLLMPLKPILLLLSLPNPLNPVRKLAGRNVFMGLAGDSDGDDDNDDEEGDDPSRLTPLLPTAGGKGNLEDEEDDGVSSSFGFIGMGAFVAVIAELVVLVDELAANNP